MVAANPTKTTAAKAAADNCRSDAPAETGADEDGELDESELELEPEPESEPEVVELAEELAVVDWEFFPVLVDFEPELVVVELDEMSTEELG